MSLYMYMSKIALTGGALLMVAGCSGRKEVALAAQNEKIRTQEQLIANERADKDALARQNEELAKQNTQLAEKNAQIAKENAERVAAMQAQMNELQKIMEGLALKPAKPGEGAPDGGGVYSVEKDGTIRITVASSVLFDSGKADLKSSSHDMLKKVSSTIKQKWPNNYIRVEGHTDKVPVVQNKDKFKDNMALSIARSRAVYDYMIKEGGIAANRMYTAGYGEHQPLVNPEKTAADRAKNRRVEIVIMPQNVKVQKEYSTAAVAPKK
ncbi:MAG TPA: OmpA family protein [Planctomycetota bacterium]|nr:OmpA family protein [Planctomycetota bacterium]